MNCTLIHFGSGALGLGLVVPEFCSLNNVDIHIVNRINGSVQSQERNRILKKKKHYVLRTLGFDCFLKFKSFIEADDDKTLNSIINQERVTFVTTALKEYGIDEMLPTLSELLHQRNASDVKCPLVFIACENAITSTAIEVKIREFLRKKFGDDYKLSENIIFLDCVVDKICNKPMIDDVNVILRAEEYCSWVISDKNIKKLNNDLHIEYIRNTLSTINVVSLVEDLDFYIRRKKWLVNSTHQLIALLAFSNNYYSVETFVESETGSFMLNGILDEIYDIYLANEPNAEKHQTRIFLDEVGSRLKNASFLVSTALTRFNHSQNLPSFFSDFQRKIGLPTEHYLLKTNQPIFWVPYTMLRVTDLISNNHYIN